MGPGGMTYQASSTTRVGPGGVRETQAVVRDGRTGTESVTISRGLGDGRQRTLVRTRDVTGREEQLEDLQGITEHEAEVFDEHWRHHAERTLPGGSAVGAHSGRLGAGVGSSMGGRGGGGAMSRQHSGGASHYAPSSGGRSAASDVNMSTGMARAPSGAAPASGAGAYSYAPGPPATAYGAGGSVGRVASSGAGTGAGLGVTGHRVSPSREEQYRPQSGASGRNPYGGGTYAQGGQGQQRHRY
ncbi:hypothetical protein GPECTOR_36g130 [Gonium pectorale]|uniref:Uncharacterized protein n=1 Tax=Gonium pectorale TaxID=33097 RepID=A0A150GBS2_GONPE|nr:hypothetical protein GPECTOR_36g130 [Gonium pectorale]|eukprot:KXZ47279.1 hypothetical protein GPECTOR_36g130 [Gonium pectorale]